MMKHKKIRVQRRRKRDRARKRQATEEFKSRYFSRANQQMVIAHDRNQALTEIELRRRRRAERKKMDAGFGIVGEAWRKLIEKQVEKQMAPIEQAEAVNV